MNARGAVVALAGFVASGLSPIVEPSADQISRALRQLAAAYYGTRSVAGRLSVDLGYAPPRDSPEEFTPPAASDDRFLDRVRASAAVQRFDAAAAPKALHALGILDLLWRRPSEAVDRLEAARVLGQPCAALEADLSAAYLERAAALGTPLDLGRALEAAERALELDSQSLPAGLQRALALERLNLREEALEAWSDLAVRSERAWALEADNHLRSLRGPEPLEEWRSAASLLADPAGEVPAVDIVALTARYPQPARILIEEVLLPAWAELALTRAPSADRLFERASLMADALAESNGDRLASDELAALSRLRFAGDAGEFATAVEGHLALGRGRRLFGQARFREASAHLAEAALLLRRQPFGAWARYYGAACNQLSGHSERAVPLLEQLWQEAPRDRYLSLVARVRWSRGLMADFQGQTGTAEFEYRIARQLWLDLGELENAAALDGLLAEVLPDLGRSREAWRHLLQGMASRRWFQNERRLDGLLFDLADALQREGLPRAALSAHAELLRLAERRSDAVASCQALLARARIENRLRQVPAVLSTIAQLYQHATAVVDADHQLSFLILGREVEAEARLAEEPGRARELVSEVLGYHQRAGLAMRLPALYRLRAAAQARAGDAAASDRDLRTALELLRRSGPGTSATSDGQGIAKTTVSVHDELARLRAVMLRDSPGAWGAAEDARASAFAGLGADGSVSPSNVRPASSTLASFQRSLPTGAQAIYYALLEDRLLIWLVERERFKMSDVDVDPRALGESIALTVQLLARSGGGRQFEAATADLFRILIGPVASELRSGSLLLLFPDKILQQVPYAALRDQTGRFLVEGHEIVVVPNAAVLRGRAARTRQLGVGRVLVVGPPRLDQEVFPDLTDLPGAEREARGVAALYPQAQLLMGERATEEAVRGLLTQASVVHIAAHAITHPRDPWRSLVPLASPSGEVLDPGLQADELASLRLRNTDLVVLAACDSAQGAFVAGQGVVSLASAFLAAGVPAVLATLLPVPDAPAESLLVAFHRELLAGEGPASALRLSQLAAIAGGAEPASWAGFQLIGLGFEPLFPPMVDP